MALSDHLNALRRKHAALGSKIETEEGRPAPDSLLIQGMKRKKLHCKDGIHRLSKRELSAIAAE